MPHNDRIPNHDSSLINTESIEFIKNKIKIIMTVYINNILYFIS